MSAFRIQSEFSLSVTILRKHSNILNCPIDCLEVLQEAEYTSDNKPCSEKKRNEYYLKSCSFPFVRIEYPTIEEVGIPEVLSFHR